MLLLGFLFSSQTLLCSGLRFPLFTYWFFFPVSPKDSGDSNNSGQQDIELYSDNDDDDAPAIYEATGRNGRKKRSNGGGGDCVNKPFLHFTL